MSFAGIQSACVIRYPYLWHREAASGETEGRKSRPVAVGLRLSRPDGHDALLLFPITTKHPGSDRLAIEIPEIEKKRGGLSSTRHLWIILDEFNQDIIGLSFYLEPEPPIGAFSKAFFSGVLEAFRARLVQARSVNRRA